MPGWPVPSSYTKRIPRTGEPGSFWEKRDNRYHCGVDIYAPAESEVWAIEDGVVLECGIQTSPEAVKYWNRTQFVLIEHDSGMFVRYAELLDILVRNGERVKEEQCIGHIGTVIDSYRVDATAPKYIRDIKEGGHISMLHIEVYSSVPEKKASYFGGNWLETKAPPYILDPMEYLKKAGGK